MKNDPQPPPKNEPPPKAPRKKREHVYEDIEEYVSRISEDTENVDKTINIHKPLDKSMFPAECFDPIFEDYVMGNENIKIKLRIQDEKFSTDLKEKHRHSELDDIEKQNSLEERDEEKTIQKQASLDVKPMHLLAPISSIDSTSSDEANNQLSIVAEESEVESSKKKDEDNIESDEDMKDVESLDGDGSVVEVFKSEPTLIESLGSKDEDKEIVEHALKEMQAEAMKEDIDIKETKIMPKWAKMT